MIAIKSLNSPDFSYIVIEKNKSISYGSFALSIHILRPFNTIIRYSSLIRLYDCVLLCLFNCHFVGEQLIFFYFVSCRLFKYVFFFPFYLWFCLHVSWYLFKFILAISLDLCHDFWSYTFCHGNHIIPVPPPLPSPPRPFPPPRPYPRPLSFVWLARIKVPMMHGATTSTVSSASTPVTNVPFAESAASNQVCSFISVLFWF